MPSGPGKRPVSRGSGHRPEPFKGPPEQRESRPSRDDAAAQRLRSAIDRDRRRWDRRESGHRSFWRSLGVLGMVGWPIALGSAGGAALGHYLDVRLQSGVRFTLILLMVGVVTGSLAAWRTMTHDDA